MFAKHLKSVPADERERRKKISSETSAFINFSMPASHQAKCNKASRKPAIYVYGLMSYD